MLRAVALALVLTVSLPARAVETMRIAMGPAEDSAELSASTLSVGEDLAEGPFSPVPGGRATIQIAHGKLELNGAPLLGDTVRFRPGTAELDAGVPGKSALHAAHWDVRGDVVARQVRGKVELINVIPLEDYLAAVLGGEMPVSFPLEALKAQAVAARTYAVHKKLEALDKPSYLGSSVLHQVYKGVNREDPRTRAAVEATRGEILTYELAPIEAYFHASCGGRTESGLAALNRDLPYLKSVECPCGKLPRSHWTLELPRREIQGVFHEAGGLEVVSRSETGRARRVQVGRRSVDAVQFRAQVGYDKVKSLAFEVAPVGKDNFLLSGRGYGHGAGLCQWGAKTYADQGLGYLAILSHYYPGAELQRLY